MPREEPHHPPPLHLKRPHRQAAVFARVWELPTGNGARCRESTWIGLHVDVGPRDIVADGTLALHGDTLRGGSRVAVARSSTMATA